jgi:hypothetical protein
MIWSIVIIVILMSSTVFVGLFSWFLNDDVDKTHEGSELLQLSETGMSVQPE